MMSRFLILFSAAIGLAFISGVESTICKCANSKFCRVNTGNYHYGVAPAGVTCRYGTIYCCKGPGSSTDVGPAARGTAIATNDGRCTCVPQSLCGSSSGKRIETSPFGCGLGQVYCCKPPVSTSSTLPPPAQNHRCTCKSRSLCQRLFGQHLEKTPWGTTCPSEEDGYCCTMETAAVTTLSPDTSLDTVSGSGCTCMTQASCFTQRGTISPYRIGCPDEGVHCCGVVALEDTDSVSASGEVAASDSSSGNSGGCRCMTQASCFTQRGTISPYKIGCPDEGVHCCGVVAIDDGDRDSLSASGLAVSDSPSSGSSKCRCMTQASCFTQRGTISPYKIACPDEGVHCCGVVALEDTDSFSAIGRIASDSDPGPGGSGCRCMDQASCFTQRGTISPYKIGCPDEGVHCCGVVSLEGENTDSLSGREVTGLDSRSGSGCRCMTQASCFTQRGTISPYKIGCPDEGVHCCGVAAVDDMDALGTSGDSSSSSNDNDCMCMARSTCLTSHGTISNLKIGCPDEGVYCCGVGSGGTDAAADNAGEDEVQQPEQ